MKGQAFNEGGDELLAEERIEECQVARRNGQKYAGFRFVFED
jgi:hypothetical protein